MAQNTETHQSKDKKIKQKIRDTKKAEIKQETKTKEGTVRAYFSQQKKSHE